MGDMGAVLDLENGKDHEIFPEKGKMNSARHVQQGVIESGGKPEPTRRGALHVHPFACSQDEAPMFINASGRT
jgi:hypothetical protein